MRAHLQYCLPETLGVEELERIVSLTNDLRAARAAVSPDVGFGLFLMKGAMYEVSLRGTWSGIARAAGEVFSRAGTPDFVMGDYRTLQSELGRYGKALERRFGDLLRERKRVVDL